MRVTREKLISLAAKETERRAQRGDVLSGYVIGSLATGDPLLGGTADIDLVLIHAEQPFSTREMLPLSDEIHLDIIHHSQAMYQDPTWLRTDPILGPSMCAPVFLYDPDHFFERAQAGVRGQFFRPDFVFQRAVNSLELARKQKQQLDSDSDWMVHYLHTLGLAVNSVALLDGLPAYGRRMSIHLREQLQQLEQEQLYAGFLALLGAQEGGLHSIASWVAAWARSFDILDAPGPELHPCRRDYFLRAFQALIESGYTVELLWPLLTQWARVMGKLEDEPHTLEDQTLWSEALQTLGLDQQSRPGRADALERYLDRIEEELEIWAHNHGA